MIRVSSSPATSCSLRWENAPRHRPPSAIGPILRAVDLHAGAGRSDPSHERGSAKRTGLRGCRTAQNPLVLPPIAGSCASMVLLPRQSHRGAGRADYRRLRGLQIRGDGRGE